MEGGSKEGTKIHDQIVEDLQKKHDYSEEEARAIKSLLYDEAKKELSSTEQGANLERAKYMKKLVTKKHLSTITDKQIKDRIQLMQERKASKTSGNKKTSKKTSKKAGVKKASKKVTRKTSKKAGVKKSSKKVVKKTSKKTGVKKTSKKVTRKTSKKVTRKTSKK